MQESLPRLARELRNETCPQRVIDETVRRIAAETPPLDRFRYGIPLTVAGLVLLGCLIIWRRTGDGNAERQMNPAARESLRGAQIARQTEGALGLIGSVLLDAGAHSERVISDRAIPPLRNGIETAKNKIMHSTDL